MATSRLTHWITNKVRPVRRPVRKKVDRGRFRPQVEPLTERVLPAVTATFSAGTLRVAGDEQDNAIVISRTAAGTILVNGGAVPLQGVTVANTTLILLNGGAGDDNLTLDEANGPLPVARLDGGAGNDVLTGGTAGDVFVGAAGNDTLFGGAGGDVFLWGPGDGSDVVEGRGGTDTLTFSGSDDAEKFTISDSGGGAPFHRTRLTRDVGNVTMDLHGVEVIDLLAGGGADTITINDQTATDIFTVNLDLGGSAGVGDNQADAVIINGTDGDDVGLIQSFGTLIAANASLFPFVNISGSGGLDALTVNGLGGNDTEDASALFATNASQLIKLTLNGGTGNDTLTGSQGFDTFIRNPGDGNDTIEGGDGVDTIVFNGSDGADGFDLSANGTRGRFTRDVDGGRTDFGGVEEIDLNALGGADTVTVNDLSGTPVTEILLSLSGTAGGTAGDSQADSVIVNGRNAADLIPVFGINGVILVNGGFANGSGLPYFMAIRAVEAGDALRINGNGGNDTVDASGLGIPVMFTADGGAGDDKLTFNGSDLAENVVISRTGDRVRLSRDVGTVTLDVSAFEGIEINALGGADTITVNDLTGTGLVKVQLDLGGSAGGGDGAADNVVVNGTNDADAVQLAAFGNTILLDELFPVVRITGSDGVNDHLTVNTLGGNDTADATNLPAGLIGLTVDLGDDQPAPPRVTGVVVNGGVAQRSMVTQIRVAFDQHVTLPANPADAFRLVRQGDGATVTLTVMADDTGAGTVVTLTFAGGAVDGASLADGRYTLTALAGQVGSPNGPVDGDADGIGGDDFVLAGSPANHLFRLFGDATGDGVVDLTDLAALRSTFNLTSANPGYLALLDADGNGVVDLIDLAAFRSRFNRTV